MGGAACRRRPQYCDLAGGVGELPGAAPSELVVRQTEQPPFGGFNVHGARSHAAIVDVARTDFEPEGGQGFLGRGALFAARASDRRGSCITRFRIT